MPPAQRIDITSSTIFRTILIIAAVWFLYEIGEIILILLAAFVIASAMEPLAKRLQYYNVPRGISIVIVYVLVLAAFVGIISLILPPLAEQAVQFARSLPQLLVSVHDRFGLDNIPFMEGFIPQLQETIQRFGENLAQFTANIFEQTRNIFSVLFSAVFVLVLAFYLVIEEDALKKLFRFIIPRQHIAYVEEVIDRIQLKLGLWVLGQLALGAIVGMAVGVGLWALGVKYALALGLLAGLLEIVPVIGPIIAGIFGVLVALSQSLLLGLGVLVFYVIVQQVENHFLVPTVMKRATGLNPLVTLIAVLIGGHLAGIVGVILSVPVATILSIFLSDFFSTPSGDEELAG